jgi:hypothetical protein
MRTKPDMDVRVLSRRCFWWAGGVVGVSGGPVVVFLAFRTLQLLGFPRHRSVHLLPFFGTTVDANQSI